jgi:cytochrome c-type biogenesis protein CcmH
VTRRPASDDAPLSTLLVTRRHFLAAVAAGAGSTLATGVLAAQSAQLPGGGPTPQQAQMQSAGMEGDAYRPVRLPARAGARAQLTDLQRDAVERQLSCPCPCTLDVFTCRTSMPTCGFSPRMHRDVIALIDGGHSGEEILRAFEQAYGEEALMAPKREGFNWVGYLMPFAALGTGGAVIATLIRRWGRRAALQPAATPLHVDANAEELARLAAAVRGDAPR